MRQWLQSLGVLSVVKISRDEAEMKLAAYVPLLVHRFPPDAFTAASLESVAARAVKGFPTYGELTAWLAEWWRASRPLPTMIAAPTARSEPPRPPPSPEEQAQVHRAVHRMLAALHTKPAEPRIPLRRSDDDDEDLIPISRASVDAQLAALGYTRETVPKPVRAPKEGQ